MRLTACALIIIFTIATLAMAFFTASQPWALGAMAFMAWTVSPYAGAAVMVRRSRTKAARVAVLAFVVILGLMGNSLIVDAMFINRDAQSALVYVFAPLMQWAILLVFLVLFYFLNKVREPVGDISRE